MKYKILIVLLIILIIVYLCNRNRFEHYTSEEALQNIASLYNQGNLVVTDFQSTDTGTFNNLTATGTTTLGTANITNGNLTNETVSGTSNINNAIVNNAHVGTMVVSGLSTLDNINVSGLSNLGNINVSGTVNSMPLVPIATGQININTPWDWDTQVWPNSPPSTTLSTLTGNIRPIIFPTISATLKPMPVGSVVIFCFAGNTDTNLAQGLVITYKVSATQYHYSPIQGLLLNI